MLDSPDKELVPVFLFGKLFSINTNMIKDFLNASVIDSGFGITEASLLYRD